MFWSHVISDGIFVFIKNSHNIHSSQLLDVVRLSGAKIATLFLPNIFAKKSTRIDTDTIYNDNDTFVLQSTMIMVLLCSLSVFASTRVATTEDEQFYSGTRISLAI